MLLRMKSSLILLIVIYWLSGLSLAQEAYRFKPNPKLTPGDAFDVTREELCSSEYTSPARKIPLAMKREVFTRHRVSPSTGAYNIDHLIPTSLGGSNSMKNLWPQPLSGEWNYQRKNRLERKLHKMVCSGAIALQNAQREIAADWVSAYKKYAAEPK